jgi:hypothetical protein
MAEDIRQNFGTDTAITITLASLADAASAVSNAIDLGAVAPFALSIEAKLDGNAAGNTGLAEIYAQWSNENTDFSDSGNDLLVGAVQMNGTTAVIKVFTVPVHARYLKLRVLNNSGAALAAAGNALRYVPVSVDQV